MRKYITHEQLIIWPRLVINIRDHVRVILIANLSDKDNVRSIRCSRIELAKQRVTAQ